MKEIHLTRGKITIVDDEDYDSLIRYKWHYNSRGYAMTSTRIDGRQTKIYMHRMILNTPKGMVSDHINGDKLDNQKRNLRVCTQLDNRRNSAIPRNKYTSQLKGVSKSKGNENWKVSIKHDGKTQFYGYYTDEIAAANAYNHYAKTIMGDFAKLNDVPYMTFDQFDRYRIKTSSIYRGVGWHKRVGKWQAFIHVEDKKTSIGYFVTEYEAALAFNVKAVEYGFDKSKLNEVDYETYSQ